MMASFRIAREKAEKDGKKLEHRKAETEEEKATEVKASTKKKPSK
tara:strand:- start:469 stop:603 length:135 start_codon:yes stop_codon:yes gene_type:complete